MADVGSLRVADVSRHDNGRLAAAGRGDTLDFASLKTAGYHAVVVRWGTGDQRDPYFTRNLHGVLAAGLEPGVYWVPYPGNDQRAGARQVLTDVRGVCGDLAGVAVVVDVEDYADGRHVSRAEYAVCGAALGDGAGHPPWSYIPRWWLARNYDGAWTDLPTHSVWWDSRYPYGSTPPPAGFVPAPLPAYLGWTPTLWQYTDAAPVLSGRTDTSAFFGDTAGWAALTGGGSGDDVSYDDVKRAIRDVLHLPAPDPDSEDPAERAGGLAIPHGQRNNLRLAQLLVGMAQQEVNRDNAEAALIRAFAARLDTAQLAAAVADAVVAQLPAGQAVDQAVVEAGVRHVLGGLDQTGPA